MWVADSLVVVGILTGDLKLLIGVAEGGHDGLGLLQVAFEVGGGADLVVGRRRFFLDGLAFFLFFLLGLGTISLALSFFVFLGVLFVNVEVVGGVRAFRAVDLLNPIQHSLIILIQIDLIVALVDNNEARLLLHLWEGLEDELWHATVVL